MKYNLQSSDDQLTVVWKNKSNKWESISYVEFNVEELKKEWVCLRTKFQLRYSIENALNYREQLLELLELTRTKICNTKRPNFKIFGTEIILKENKGLVGIGKNAKISAALQQITNDQNSKSSSTQFETLNMVLAAGDEDATVNDLSAIFSSESDSIVTYKIIFPDKKLK